MGRGVVESSSVLYIRYFCMSPGPHTPPYINKTQFYKKNRSLLLCVTLLGVLSERKAEFLDSTNRCSLHSLLATAIWRTGAQLYPVVEYRLNLGMAVEVS